MIRDNEHWLKLADGFNSAALGVGAWDTALSEFATACGARTGQLVGFSEDTAVPFNWITDVDPQCVPDFIKVKGGDPVMNPRVRAGRASPVLKVLADCDYVIGDEMLRPTPYTDYCRQYDLPYVCQTNLFKGDQLLIVLAVLRTARQGHITQADRDVFSAIAPHARSAVMTQIALEGRGAELLAGAFEALSFAAFICDREDKVRAMTPTAEQLIGQRQGIQLKQGRLSCMETADEKILANAIRLAACHADAVGRPRLQTVVIRQKSAETRLPLILDVMALPPKRHEFTFAARTAIVVRGGRQEAANSTFLLQATFGLTVAEAEVALLLAEGASIETIALRRSVADSTIRYQLKSIYSKLGVGRQIELAALLRDLR